MGNEEYRDEAARRNESHDDGSFVFFFHAQIHYRQPEADQQTTQDRCQINQFQRERHYSKMSIHDESSNHRPPSGRNNPFLLAS